MGILAFRALIFNPSATGAYGQFYDRVSWERTKGLIRSNPGVVGAVLLVATKAVQEAITGLWRVLVYNDQNKVHHEFWGQYTWSGYGKMIGGHWAGPGVMNAVAGLGILAFRALIFNPSALNNYTTFWNERSVGSIKTLCQSNPGALGAAGCAFASFLETGARLFLWNPTFAAKDFMFGMEEETSTLQAIGISSTDQGRHFGLMLDKWPGLIYGSLLLATKYGLINWRAYPDYMDAIKAVGGASEMQKLVLKSPGCIAFIAFMTLKLVEEIGFHILIDPRQLDAYRAYEENPGYDTAKGLFASGVVGAAFFALGIAVQRAGSSVARGLGA